jgi:V8-like Glu-specific endopeptidase
MHMMMDVTFLALLLSAAWGGLAQESEGLSFVSLRFPAAAATPFGASEERFWTPERYAAAKPLIVNMSRVNKAGSFAMPAPRTRGGALFEGGRRSASTAASTGLPSREGTPPVAAFSLQPQTMYNGSHLAAATAAAKAAAAKPAESQPGGGAHKKTPQEAAGLSGAYYTSSRLVPLSADLYYPYSAVGKLFFEVDASTGSTSTGSFVCSGSVVGPRLVLTAGHCVHSGQKSMLGFYRELRFVPAFRDGQAPFGVWTVQRVLVTRTWSVGGGTLPNPADYALLVMNDLNGQSIGSVVGQLGYAIESLAPNHIHMLGYPCRLDRCQKMQAAATGSYYTLDFAPNCIIYGSNFGPGASGGPWVQNLGMPGTAEDEVEASRSGVNAVVGVTSFVFTDARVMALGSSILDTRLADMVTAACGAASGSC